MSEFSLPNINNKNKVSLNILNDLKLKKLKFEK